jgi:pimeloyl-ACP methyl ester carboxylesterase
MSLVDPDVRLAVRVSRLAPRVAAGRLERWGRLPVPPTGADDTDAAYTRGRAESFRHGGLWLARELAYLARPWGFELGDVRVPVTLWWGTEDRVCPPSIAHDYARALPEATLRLVDGGTHQLLFSAWAEILTDLAERDTYGV